MPNKKISQFNEVISVSENAYFPLISGQPEKLENYIISKQNFTNSIVTSLSGVTKEYVDELVSGETANRIDGDTNLYNLITGLTEDLNGKSDTGHTHTEYSKTGHTHYQLHQPDGTNPFVYTDNGGNLHIDGNIYQSGSTYETHAEQVYTTKDDIILRDGASAGLSTGELAGLTIKNYDGSHDGSLKIDKDGWMRVGDAGSEQKIATIEETTLNDYIMKYNTSTLRLEGINPTSLPVSTASDLKYVNQDGGTIWYNNKWFTPNTGQTASSSGTTVTITNPTTNFQFTSAMVGAKFGFGTDRRIITAYISTTQVTVESVFSQNYSGVTSTGWGVYSRAYLPIDGGSTNNVYDTGGVKTIFVDNDGNYNANCTYALFNFLEGNTVGIKSGYLGLASGTKIVATDQAGSGYQSTPDIGLRRSAAGMWEVFNGVNNGSTRDVKLRNLYADNVLTTSGGTKYLNEDGGITYHIAKRFTPTTGSTASSSGTTVTLSGSTQFTSGMVGAKFGFGSDKRVITAYVSTSQVTVDSAFSQNYSGISDWGVYSVYTRSSTQSEWNANNINFRTYNVAGGEILSDGYGRFNFSQPIADGQNTFYVEPSSYPYAIKLGGTRRIGFFYNKTGGNDLDNLSTSLYTTSDGWLQIDKGSLNNRAGLITKTQRIGTLYQTQLQTATNNTSITGITVESTTDFPSTGTLLISGVTSIAYTGKTSTTFTFTATTVPTYPIGVEVLLTSAGSYTEVTSDGSLKVKNTTSGATVFNVQGTTGQLFQVNDVQEGTLHSVSDISGINLFSVDSSGYILQNSGQQIGMTGTTTVYQIDKTKGSACFIDYRVSNATTGAFRAGTISGVWDNVNNRIEFTETSTNDLYASTSGIVLSMTISGNYVNLISTISTGTWNIKLGVRII